MAQVGISLTSYWVLGLQVKSRGVYKRWFELSALVRPLASQGKTNCFKA
jgi:hypothetical protein